MKKQITIVSALAAALLSSSLFAATIGSNTTVNSIAHTADRQNVLTGATAQYVTDNYNFNLSAGVAFKFVQNATAVGAAAATLKGSKAIFGGSTSGGLSECAGEISDEATATPGDPTATSGCAGSGSGGS